MREQCQGGRSGGQCLKSALIGGNWREGAGLELDNIKSWLETGVGQVL